MQSTYPNPCLKCTRQACKKNSSQFRECSDWLTWFRWWWKRFHTYPAKAPITKTTDRDKFYYAHPDEIRRALKKHPCEGCRNEKCCDTPCAAYLAWYDARMAVARKKVQG